MKHNESVTSTSSQIIKPDDSREQVIIHNDDAVRVVLAFESPAVFTQGTFIDAEHYSLFDGDFAKRAIYAVTESTGATVRIEEI